MTEKGLDGFRSHFPIFRDRVYVNSCSQGALADEVRQAFDAFLDSWDAEGSPWEAWVVEVERLRSSFARFVGASDDEVAVLPSASAGINAVASALRFEGPRDGVVMGEFEFPTMAQVWLAQQRRGARIAWARPRGETLDVDAYAALVDERTLVVPATHVCFRNGFRLDVAALARLCRERGAYLFLDDYQRTGSAPLDVHALGVDFMVTGCLKYLLGPAGVAFLYVRKELIERLEPTVTGWFGRVDPFAFAIDRLDWSPSARRFEAGTPPVPNAFAARAGIELLLRYGAEPIEARVRALAGRLIEQARQHGFVVATPAEAERRSSLVVLRSSDAARLVERLKSHGVLGSSRGDGLRISFHGYNTAADVDAVVAALQAERALLRRSETAQV